MELKKSKMITFSFNLRSCEIILGQQPLTGEYLQKCRMRTFNLMLMNLSKLSIWYGPCVLVSKTEKVAALHFFRYPPVRSLNLGFFHTFSLVNNGFQWE
jgi:hypothetical protein